MEDILWLWPCNVMDWNYYNLYINKISFYLQYSCHLIETRNQLDLVALKTVHFACPSLWSIDGIFQFGCGSWQFLAQLAYLTSSLTLCVQPLFQYWLNCSTTFSTSCLFSTFSHLLQRYTCFATARNYKLLAVMYCWSGFLESDKAKTVLYFSECK